uniref:Protein kinase domain-containing protein n=1 Tax=Oryzias melastigma TaxID=30732 RepID=A0A3B3BF38_ORYME
MKKVEDLKCGEEVKVRMKKSVEKFLGEGTFGKVAKCREVATNQEVAVKILKNKYKDQYNQGSLLTLPFSAVLHSLIAVGTNDLRYLSVEVGSERR